MGLRSLIISRSKSTSELFSKSARRLIMSVVIVGSSVGLKASNQTLPKLYDDHRPVGHDRAPGIVGGRSFSHMGIGSP